MWKTKNCCTVESFGSFQQLCHLHLLVLNRVVICHLLGTWYSRFLVLQRGSCKTCVVLNLKTGLLFQLAAEIIQQTIPIFSFFMLFLIQARFDWELNRYIFRGISVINCFCSQELYRNDPVLHLKISVTSEEKVSHTLFLLLLVKPRTCTKTESRHIASCHFWGHCLKYKLYGNRS